MLSPDLIWTTVVRIWYLQISFEPPTSITEMTAFTRWMWHKTYQTFYCLTTRLYLESECDYLSSDLCNLPITFELPSSEYDISRSHLNHRRQLLRWLHSRDEYGTKHIRHSLAFPRDYTSIQNAMVLVLSYGISRSHLNHRCQLLRRLHSIEWCGT